MLRFMGSQRVGHDSATELRALGGQTQNLLSLTVVETGTDSLKEESVNNGINFL